MKITTNAFLIILVFTTMSCKKPFLSTNGINAPDTEHAYGTICIDNVKYLKLDRGITGITVMLDTNSKVIRCIK